MVHIPPKAPMEGPAWNIHISMSPLRQLENAKPDSTEPLPKAVQIAQWEKQRHPSPSWMQNVNLPLEHDKQITQRAIDVYMLSKKSNGEMGGIGWWQTANGYTAMALHDMWSGDDRNYDDLGAAIRECEVRHKNLMNPFNDDMLWWGMLCLYMYTAKEDYWFLEQAHGIWKHVSRSVCRRGEVFFQDNDMEGAVFWTTRPGEDQINAITTGLFAELSVRLALVKRTASQSVDVSYESYVEAARSSLGWILRCRYLPKEGIVLDNIRLKEGKANDWIFTYNTGVTLGVCALLFEATNENDYLVLAQYMAMKAMTFTGTKGWVEDDGVLTEKHAYGRGTHDPWKPNDAVGFKAVLVRHLCILYDVIGRTEDPNEQDSLVLNTIRHFISVNFRSQIERNSNSKGQYGPWWAGPFEYPSSHSQMAVLDVMAAVRLINR